jgi:hypothetical protein
LVGWCGCVTDFDLSALDVHLIAVAAEAVEDREAKGGHTMNVHRAARGLKIAATALAALVVVGVGAACFSYEACTLVGCNSNLVFEAPWAQGAASFHVELDSPDVAGSFDCLRGTGPQEGVFVLDESSLAGDFSLDVAAPFTAHCEERTFLFGFLPRQREVTMPSDIAVTVTTADDARSRTFTAIDYDVSQPNGEACEPTCLSARLIVE